MFKHPVTDPTAGERARQLGLDPARPLPILDPTDPRYGTSASGSRSEQAPISEAAENERPEQP